MNLNEIMDIKKLGGNSIKHFILYMCKCVHMVFVTT